MRVSPQCKEHISARIHAPTTSCLDCFEHGLQKNAIDAGGKTDHATLGLTFKFTPVRTVLKLAEGRVIFSNTGYL